MPKNYSYLLIAPKIANQNLGRQWRPSYVKNWPEFTVEVKRYSEAYAKAPYGSVKKAKIGSNFSQAYNKWLRQTEQNHMKKKHDRANEMRVLLKSLGVRKNVMAGSPFPNRPRKSPNRTPVARRPSTPRTRRQTGAKPLDLRRALGHAMVKRNTNRLLSNITKKRNNIASASSVLSKLKGPARNRQKALIEKLEANLNKLRNLISQAP
jgi:biopolymer transport protein ExbB/TolQ